MIDYIEIVSGFGDWYMVFSCDKLFKVSEFYVYDIVG